MCATKKNLVQDAVVEVLKIIQKDFVQAVTVSNIDMTKSMVKKSI